MDLRHLTEDDLLAAARVFVSSLGDTPPEDADRFRTYWDVARTLVAYGDDGRLLGVAARFDSELTAVGGAALRCGAVPSVGVRPDSHGQGVGRALLERQVAEAVASGDQVMALNASEVTIYGRYGYGPTSAWWSVEADPRLLAWRADAPAAEPGSIREIEAAEAATTLPALYERAYGRWAGELRRHDGWWPRLLEPRKGKDPSLFAVHLDPATGEPDAAVTFGVTLAFDRGGFANRVDVHDLFGLDAGAEALLLRWLVGRNLAGHLTMERCNPRSPIRLMLRDGRRWVTTEHNDAVWVRVLDVPGVVAARTTVAADGREVVVHVEDPLVAANTGSWVIGAEGGRLRCERSDAAPELRVGVDVLAPLLWGWDTAAMLAAAGRIGVVGPDAVARLDALVAVTDPSWCSTGF